MRSTEVNKARKEDAGQKKLQIDPTNLLYICACIVIVLSTFFPYVYDEQSISLMESTDGIFFLMFAILICVFMRFGKKKTVGILGTVMLALCIYELVITYSVTSKSGNVISRKAGFYIFFAGAVVLLAAICAYWAKAGAGGKMKDFLKNVFPVKKDKEEKK